MHDAHAHARIQLAWNIKTGRMTDDGERANNKFELQPLGMRGGRKEGRT